MLKRFLLLAVVLFSYNVFAADVGNRVAFIDGTAIMKKYEGSIEEKLHEKFKSQEEAMNKLQKELVDKTETYTRDFAMMSDTEKASFQKDFESKQMEFQQKGAALNEERMKEGNAELEKLLNTVKTAAEKVAKDQNFDIVLQAGAAIYYDNALDITKDVLAQLDKR